MIIDQNEAAMYSLSQAGIIFDIVGAGIIAWSFLSAHHQEMVRAAERTMDEMIDIRGMVSARNDAIFGFPLLAFGFILQFISPWIDGEMTHLQLSIAATGLLVLITAGYALFRTPLINAVVERVRNDTAGHNVLDGMGLDGGGF